MGAGPILDRYQGCLLGVALGDALGAPYEFKHPPFEVDTAAFGTGCFGTAPGHPTDDSTLAVACAEALLEGEDLNPDGFPTGYVRRLVAWATSDPPDIGNQTRRAVAAWRAGHPPPDDDHAQGNGSLMAVAPIGLRFAGDHQAARAAAEGFARLTHPNAAAAECNVTYVGLLSAAVHGEDLSVVSVPAPPGAGDPAGPSQGWCRLTLHLAARAVEDAEKVGPFEALVRLIGRGGDADTNAAVAGGLLGAVHGTGAWPAHLLDRLALRERMEQLATDLWRLAETGSRARR